jgi:hypothetical protein
MSLPALMMTLLPYPDGQEDSLSDKTERPSAWEGLFLFCSKGYLKMQRILPGGSSARVCIGEVK